MSDTSSPKAPEVRLDPEAEALKLEQVKAEAVKAIADARRATVEAALPKTTATPLEGTVTTGEGSGFIAELATYAVLDEAVREIVETLPAEAGRVLVVPDRDILSADWTYTVVSDELARHSGALDAAEKLMTSAEGPGQVSRPADKGLAAAPALGLAPALALAPALIGAAASVVSWFRTDVTLAGRAVSVTTDAVTSALAARSCSPSGDGRARHVPPA